MTSVLRGPLVLAEDVLLIPIAEPSQDLRAPRPPSGEARPCISRFKPEEKMA